MNRLLAILLLALSSACAFGNADVRFVLANFQMESLTNHTFWVIPLSTPTTAGGATISSNPRYTNTGSGTIILSNVVAGTYRCEIRDSDILSFWKIEVPNTNGLINADGLIVVTVTGSTATNTMTIAAARALFVLQNNGVGQNLSLSGPNGGGLALRIADGGSVYITNGSLIIGQGAVSLGVGTNKVRLVPTTNSYFEDILSTKQWNFKSVAMGGTDANTVSTLADIAITNGVDVSSAGLAEGQGLYWNDTLKKWTNAAAPRLRQFPFTEASTLMAMNRMLHVMFFGDSTISTDGFSDALEEEFVQHYGFAGFIGQPGYLTGTLRYYSQVTAGGYITNDLTRWYGNHAVLPPGGVLTVGQYSAGAPQGALTANVFQVTFAYSNGYGGFKAATNDYWGSGGPGTFVVMTNVVCNAPLAQGYETNITITISNQFPVGTMFQLTSLSNTVRIISIGMWNSTQPGVLINQQAVAGHSLSQWTAIPTNLAGPVYRTWSPDLLIFKTVNSGSVSISNNLAPFTAFLNYWMPRTRVELCGFHPVEVNDADVVAENVALKKCAGQNGYDYFPSHEILADNFTYGKNLGYLQAGANVHVTTDGGPFYAWHLWAFMNLMGDRGLTAAAPITTIQRTFKNFGPIVSLPRPNRNVLSADTNTFASLDLTGNQVGWADVTTGRWMTTNDAIATITTSDNTTNTIFSFTPRNNSLVRVTAEVVGYNATSSACYGRVAAFKTVAGTVTQVGATATLLLAEDDAVFECLLDTAANAVRLRVAGNTAKSVNWKAFIALKYVE